MAAKKRKTLEDELNALVAADLRSPEGREQLKVALTSQRHRVVARAATFVRERHLDGVEPLLQEAFERFLVDGAKTDMGCLAKTALIEALDALEWSDSDFFVKATRVVQPEPEWKESADTAGGVRARGLYALARLGYPDLILLAGEAFTDPQASVRLAAAEALAHFGVRHGAGVLLLALDELDDDPLVTLATMSALVSLAPEVGLARLTPLLQGDEVELHELAALALGQSNRADAADGSRCSRPSACTAAIARSMPCSRPSVPAGGPTPRRRSRPSRPAGSSPGCEPGSKRSSPPPVAGSTGSSPISSHSKRPRGARADEGSAPGVANRGGRPSAARERA